jgi:hypothetical protein
MAQIWAMNQFAAFPASASRYAPDGTYAFARLALSLLIATLIGVGMWAIIVVLPEAQRDFGVDRSAASLPYTVMMCALAVSTIPLGRMTDRHGVVLPLIFSALTLGLGFVLAGYAPNFPVFAAAHVLIGAGAGTGFGPMMADISHWFLRRRGTCGRRRRVRQLLRRNDLARSHESRDAADRLAGNLRRHWYHRRRRPAARSGDAPPPLRRRL